MKEPTIESRETFDIFLSPIHQHRMKSVQIRSFFWSVFSSIRTEYGVFVISPNEGKYGPEKLLIWTLFTQYNPEQMIHENMKVIIKNALTSSFFQP